MHDRTEAMIKKNGRVGRNGHGLSLSSDGRLLNRRHRGDDEQGGAKWDASLSGSSAFAKATADIAEASSGGVPRAEAPRSD